MAFDAPDIEANVASLGRQRSERETQGVRSVAADPIGILFAGGLFYLRRILWLHKPRDALMDKCFEIDTIDEIDDLIETFTIPAAIRAQIEKAQSAMSVPNCVDGIVLGQMLMLTQAIHCHNRFATVFTACQTD